MFCVLSVDDDVEWLKLFGETFRNAGCEHVAAVDSDQALQILRSRPVDLLTQDISRPGLGGFEFYALLQADPQLKVLPVMFISGHPGIMEYAAEWKFNRGVAFLERPISTDEMLVTAERFLRQQGKHLPCLPDLAQQLYEALALVDSEHHQEAYDVLLKAVERFPDDTMVHYHLARICYLRKDYAEARLWFSKVTESEFFWIWKTRRDPDWRALIKGLSK